MRAPTAGLVTLAASLAVAILAAWVSILLVVSWALALWGLLILVREPKERRFAIPALVVFVAFLGIGLLAIGVSVGVRGRPLGGLDALGVADLLMNLAILAPAIATSIVLAGRSAAPRALGIAGIVAGALTILVIVVDQVGDPIGGLVALTGLALVAFAAAGLASAIRREIASPDGVIT